VTGGNGRADAIVEAATEAAAGGVDHVQVREPALSDRELLWLVRRVVVAVEPFGARVLVNERLDVALLAGAHGVHLKWGGLQPAQVREAVARRGDESVARAFTIGLATHDAASLARADADLDVDYCTVGPLHASPGKQALGVDGVRELLEEARRRRGASLRVPWLLLGGVREEDVALTGTLERPGESCGLAAIRLFLGAVGDARRGPRAVASRMTAASARCYHSSP
jgi:thiamine-phosphate pyrophosphorylase